MAKKRASARAKKTASKAPATPRTQAEILEIGKTRYTDLTPYEAGVFRKLTGLDVYAGKMQRAAERSRGRYASARDVGPIPPIADMERRVTAGSRLAVWLKTYFPTICVWDWSDDHRRVLERMQRCIDSGGQFGFAMPRGSGKTTLAILAAMWAVLTGRRPYVCLIGATQDRSVQLLSDVRSLILSPASDLLAADYPEAMWPLRQLENNARRQANQTVGGELTHIIWGNDTLVFPTVTGERLPVELQESGSPSAGCIISATSLDSNIRGQHHVRLSGEVVRPSLVLIDDPQTRESARSPMQTKRRLDLLQGDVLGLAGPGKKIAAFLACTKMYDGDLADQILDREKNPQWQGECTKLVYQWPKNEKLWDAYRKAREESLRAGRGGMDATEFYREHREEMDEGSRVAWPQRHTDEELSAIQHAYNLLYDMGPEAFNAEYQNEPAAMQDEDVHMISPMDLAARYNGRARGEVPLGVTKLTAFIDVHKEILYYTVTGWEENYTGYVIEYGTWPEQPHSHFVQARPPKTLGMTYKGSGEDAAIQAGLEHLVARLLEKNWQVSGGQGLRRIDRLLVDMGYKPGIVAAVKHKRGGQTMMLAKGVGLKAGAKPIAMYQKRPGWRLGCNWFIPSVRGTAEFPHVVNDVNWWKSFIHDRLLVAVGDPGSLTLYGGKDTNHAMFSEHVAGSEYYVMTSGHGRDVKEWKWRPERPDNHWFDCLVGCAAAASLDGLAVPGTISVRRQAPVRPASQRVAYL